MAEEAGMEVLANLADRAPLLLVIDDVQWADEPSQRFLAHFCRRLEGLVVAVALARRSGEPGAGSQPLEALVAEDRPLVLLPQPLISGGNPFLLDELLLTALARREDEPLDAGAVRDLGAPAIAAAILRRVAHLGNGAPALARAVAVLGEDAGTSPAAGLAELGRTEAAALANRLIEARVPAPRDDPADGALRFAYSPLEAQ